MNTVWSYADNAFICTIEKYPSLSVYGETAEKVETEMKELVEFCDDWMEEDGEKIS